MVGTETLGSGPALAALLLAVAVLLAAPPRPRSPYGDGSADSPASAPAATPAGPSRLVQWLVAGLAGLGVALFLGGTVGLVAGCGTAWVAWRTLSSAEPAAVRRAREQATRDLPHLVGLMAAGLRAGAPPAAALAGACAALGGPAAEAFGPARARLALGVDPVVVWSEVSDDVVPGIATLGRALARAHRTGASVRQTVEELAVQLAAEGRAATEDRARSVGVKAALPLGLCLLPAFLLLGIVPLVGGLAAQLLSPE